MTAGPPPPAPTFELRPFREEDRAQCQAIAAAAALTSYAAAMPGLGHTFVPDWPLEEAANRWVAVTRAQIIGFVEWTGSHVENLFVSPPWQGRRIGSSLMNMVEAAAPGPLTLTVFVDNPGARRLYERLGFSVLEEGRQAFRGEIFPVLRMGRSAGRPGARSLVAFDFDGTLADSAGWMLGVLPTIMDEFNLRPLSVEALQALRDRPARDILRALRVRWWKLPRIAARLRAMSEADADGIRLFPEAAGLLARLRERNVRIAILSSNSEAAVRRVLAPDLAALVEDFDCGVSMFGKAGRLRRLGRRLGLRPDQITYIGDETRDVEAARRAHVFAAAVGWGYATPEALRRSSPDALVHSWDDLERLLDQSLSPKS